MEERKRSLKDTEYESLLRSGRSTACKRVREEGCR
jgi:hypothetical protein